MAGVPDPLAGIRKRASAAANFVLADDIEHEEYRRLEASALDVPLLLGAVEAPLKLHARWEIRDNEGEGELLYPVCRHCCAADGDGQTEECADEHDVLNCYPCPTVRAIAAALAGKEGDDEK
jgi:hypothetical protein